MAIAAAVLFLSLPGALAAVLFGRARLLDSALARTFAAWFLGECLAVFATYLVATALAPFTTGVLVKAALAVLAATVAFLVAIVAPGFARDGGGRRPTPRRRPGISTPAIPLSRGALAGRALYLALCAAFSFFFYRGHVVQTREAILRTPIYWDLSVHAPIVQNFVHGDNFPAGNASFAGAPLTYHFFFDLATAIPAALGVSLADSFWMTSAVTLFALLGLLAGFAEELAGGPLSGMLAAAFAMTSSSLRFLWDFRPAATSRGWAPAAAFEEAARAHPYLVSFLPRNPFAYNGTMFNLFYLLEERQLVFATGFLLAATLLLTTRARWSPAVCVAVGALFGLFVFWHLFVTAMLGLALLWLLALDRGDGRDGDQSRARRRNALLVFATMALVGAGFLVWTAEALRPEWFLQGSRGAVRYNTAFSTVPGGPPFSLLRCLEYWGFAWGLKAPLAIAGLVAAFRTRRVLFHALAGVIVPAFLLVNTIQLVPLSVYDNHKWLRPMSFFLDLAAAYALVAFVGGSTRRLPVLRRLAAAAAIPFLTISGVVEGLPFFTSRATVLYAPYPSRFTRDIRTETAPRDVFASFESSALHLAGRKLYVGNDADERGAASLVASAGFDLAARHRVVFELYAAPTREAFCRDARAADVRIDWLEVEPGVRRESGADADAPGFDTVSPEGRPLRYLDVPAFCGPSRP